MRQINLKPEEETFHQFIDLNVATFEAGHLDAAYHTLAAALHWARDFSKAEWLTQVEDLANKQQSWIDQNDARYHHSTQSAEKRGNPAILRQLARKCQTAKSIISTASRVERMTEAR